MLYLPRNLRIEGHRVLYLPRNAHFKVHQVLRPPRNLHCTSRFTKCCGCHELCTSRFAKCWTCHEICASRFTKCCTCHEICASRFTKCCHEICSSRLYKCCDLRIEGHRVLCLPRNLQTSHVSKSRESLHLSRNQSSSTITTIVLRLPRKLHFEVRQLRSLAPVTKSRLWSTKTRGFPCACHEK